ncbi:MAG: InlB B-repeat-containing protein [Christensenella sp.]
MKRIFIVILVVLTLIMCSVPAFAAPAAGTYTVTATAEPAEGGDVTGGGNIAHGKNAELAATPKDGYVFTGWFRPDETTPFDTNPSFTYSLEEDRTYIAKFEKKYMVTLNATPADGGSVAQSGTEYALNASVTVTATPAESYNFIGWFASPTDESPISAEPSYTFTLTADTSLHTKFAATYKLDLTVSPEGTGSVVGGGSYSGGSVVTVGASPEKDWRFTGWYDATIPGKIISTDPEYNFNLDENRTLGARFDRSYGYIAMWVLIWIGISFAAFVIIMRTIRHFRIAHRRSYRNRRRPPTRRY